jgi:hypothetical protein
MVGERWFQARNEVARSIAQLNENQKFLVILYNSDTSVMLGMRGSKIECLPATEANRNRALRWLARQYPALDTFPLRSMKIAVNLKPDAIFLLSDGEFRDGTISFLREANHDKNNSFATYCSVHTIAFKSYVGASVLQQIARENNGFFKYIR